MEAPRGWIVDHVVTRAVLSGICHGCLPGDTQNSLVQKMKICMIGAGYVGLVSGTCFADLGWTVTCVEKDSARLADLLNGVSPIYEPGLEDLMAANMRAGRLSFTNDIGGAVASADIVFIGVGTPMRRGDGHADLSYVFGAIDEMSPHLKGFTVIVTKSTVPVGTGARIESRLRELRPDADFNVCSNPEFLREGTAIQDFVAPDRVLVGTHDTRARALMERIYEPLSSKGVPVMFVSRESAELAKYASNAFLAMKISFINELADLCEVVGADVHEVAAAIGKDKRIGDKFLQPGPGYGGSCLPKDVSAIIRTGREHKTHMSLVEAVERVNHERKIACASRIEKAAGGSVRGKTIAVLGVTFKANTDDMRDAPSLVILPLLQERGATIRIYDPQGRKQGEPLLPGVTWCENAAQAAQGADVLVILTEWNEFRSVDLDLLSKIMRGRVLVDLRNILHASDAAAAGFSYSALGRH